MWLLRLACGQWRHPARLGVGQGSWYRRDLTPRSASKKQKKMALLRPLLSARGPTPAKKGARPPPPCIVVQQSLHTMLLPRQHGPSTKARVDTTSFLDMIQLTGHSFVWPVRGPPPASNIAEPAVRGAGTCAVTHAAAPASVGRLLALHIMTVLRTSSGVVAAAAAAPAAPPIMRSSTTVGCSCTPQTKVGSCLL